MIILCYRSHIDAHDDTFPKTVRLIPDKNQFSGPGPLWVRV